MTKTKALFYPWIEIRDENWLKSSLLFGDEIRTIVPQSIKKPYNSRTSSILLERKVLKPEIVNPDHEVVKEISKTIIDFMNTEEGQRILFSGNQFSRLHQDKLAYLHHDKFGYQINRLLRLHPEKLTYELEKMIMEGEEDGWLLVNSSFASFYMTLLANKICEQRGLSLLTDDPLNANLTTKVKQGLTRPMPERRSFAPETINHQIANGIFINLVIKKIDFHPSTNVIDILSFKKDHKDDLGNFRTNIKKLIEKVPTETTIEAMTEEINSIYNDEFLPSFNRLTEDLKEGPIKFTCENFLKIGFFSVPTAAIPTYLLGMTIPQALLAGASVSLIASLILYNLNKKKTLREYNTPLT